MAEGEHKLLVLVIEDQRYHLQVIERVLAESKTLSDVVVMQTAEQGLDYLYRRGDYAQAKRPDFILLNVHLADGAGATVLSLVKADVSLRRIPIVVLTHLADSDAILASYQQQCNCYVLKPQDLEHLDEVVRAVESFWFNIVTLPAK